MMVEILINLCYRQLLDFANRSLRCQSGDTILSMERLVGWVYRRTRATQWTITASLGLIPKDGPETRHQNFDLSRRGWLPCFVNPCGD